MKKTRNITRTPAIPAVPPAPAMRASLAIAADRLMLLADGAAKLAADSVKAGRIEEAITRLDQASDALSYARRADADVTERVETLAKLRAVVESIERISA